MQFDVIVVGGGMVGLTCVLALANQGFKVALVEAQATKPKPLPTEDQPFDNRVVAISRASEKLFRELNVFSIMQNIRSCAYQHMKVWDEAMDGSIHFCAMDYFEPDLGHIIEQQVILGALWQKLFDHKEVTCFWGVTPTTQLPNDKSILLTLSSNEILEGKLVIAADGAHSAMRSLCHVPSSGWDYQQKALVATVKGTLSHHYTAFQRFSSDGSLALLPLADPYHSSIVWATSSDNASTLCQLEESVFNQTLTREIANVMGDLELKGSRFTFELRTHHAKHYAASRCVFVGDAAHTLHPLAGQGVNLGLLDVAQLVNELKQAKEKSRDFGAMRVLERYERRRKWHNQAMIWSMELFKRGFASQNHFIQRIRNMGLQFVDRQKTLKQLFAKVAMGTL
jgi:2-octaprenylphenol hydroxylase